MYYILITFTVIVATLLTLQVRDWMKQVNNMYEKNNTRK